MHSTVEPFYKQNFKSNLHDRQIGFITGKKKKSTGKSLFYNRNSPNPWKQVHDTHLQINHIWMLHLKRHLRTHFSVNFRSMAVYHEPILTCVNNEWEKRQRQSAGLTVKVRIQTVNLVQHIWRSDSENHWKLCEHTVRAKALEMLHLRHSRIDLWKQKKKGHCKPRQLLITVSHTRAAFVFVYVCACVSLTDSLSLPCCVFTLVRF